MPKQRKDQAPAPTAADIILVATATVVGGLSMLLFGLFMVARFRGLLPLGLNEGAALLLDAGLSLAFFAQHSVMIRRSFRRATASAIPERRAGAVYSIASGIVLVGIVILWQGSDGILFSAEGVLRWCIRAISLLAMAGIVSGTRALGSFDPLGIRPILGRRHRAPRATTHLVIQGPYRWVRHPLYFFVLVMIWAYPDLTPDRLLFNVLWTMWMFVGTRLEERDLVREFGDAYRDYQRNVPMLIPRRPRAASGSNP